MIAAARPARAWRDGFREIMLSLISGNGCLFGLATVERPLGCVTYARAACPRGHGDRSLHSAWGRAVSCQPARRGPGDEDR